MFVAQVLGHSMEPRVPDGAWCLFSAPVEGTRQGKTVLVELRYESGKGPKGGTADCWHHVRVMLRPRMADGRGVVAAQAQAGKAPEPTSASRRTGRATPVGSVGIRASEACRRCAGRSAHHDRPSWQAQCELRAIGAAVSRTRPRWPPPGQSLATTTISTRPAATGLEAPGTGCPAPSSPGLLEPCVLRPTLGPRPQEEPTVHTIPGGIFYFGQLPDISTLV